MFSGIEISAIHAADIPESGAPFRGGQTLSRGRAVFHPARSVNDVDCDLGAEWELADIVTGRLQSAQTILDRFDVGWLLPVFGFCVVTGLLQQHSMQIINGAIARTHVVARPPRWEPAARDLRL